MELDADDLGRGKRLAEAVNLHLLADPEGNRGRWVAFRLSDGGTDNTAYTTRNEAVTHQHDEFQCGYLQIAPDGITSKQAAIYVKYNRALAAKGYRMPDPQTQQQADRGVWLPNGGRLNRAQRRFLSKPYGNRLN